MAVESNLICKTYEAGEDLSTKQFYFVKYDGTVGDTGCPRVVVCTGLTDVPCGVLQDKPDTVGEACLVAVFGETKVSADAALSVGDFIGPAADGQADARTIGTDTTHYVAGRITLSAGAAGRIASAFINCVTPHRAA